MSFLGDYYSIDIAPYKVQTGIPITPTITIKLDGTDYSSEDPFEFYAQDIFCEIYDGSTSVPISIAQDYISIDQDSNGVANIITIKYRAIQFSREQTIVFSPVGTITIQAGGQTETKNISDCVDGVTLQISNTLIEEDQDWYIVSDTEVVPITETEGRTVSIGGTVHGDLVVEVDDPNLISVAVVQSDVSGKTVTITPIGNYTGNTDVTLHSYVPGCWKYREQTLEVRITKVDQTWTLSAAVINLFDKQKNIPIKLMGDVYGDVTCTGASSGLTAEKTTIDGCVGYYLSSTTTVTTSMPHVLTISSTGNSIYNELSKSLVVYVNPCTEQSWTLSGESSIYQDNTSYHNVSVDGDIFGTVGIYANSNKTAAEKNTSQYGYLQNIIYDSINKKVQFKLNNSKLDNINSDTFDTFYVYSDGGDCYKERGLTYTVTIKFVKKQNWKPVTNEITVYGNDTELQKISIAGGIVSDDAKIGYYNAAVGTFNPNISERSKILGASMTIDKSSLSDRYIGFKLDTTKTGYITEDTYDTFWVKDQSTSYYNEVLEQIYVKIRVPIKNDPTWYYYVQVDSLDLTIGETRTYEILSANDLTAISSLSSVATVTVDHQVGKDVVTIKAIANGVATISLNTPETLDYKAGDKKIIVAVGKKTPTWYTDSEVILPIGGGTKDITITNMSGLSFSMTPASADNTKASWVMLNNTISFTPKSTGEQIFTLSSAKTATYISKSQAIKVRVIPDLTFKEVTPNIKTSNGFRSADVYIAVKENNVLRWKKVQMNIATKN